MRANPAALKNTIERADLLRTLFHWPFCDGGRKPEYRDSAGARSIYHDVLDVIAHCDGWHADITCAPDRWAFVLDVLA